MLIKGLCLNPLLAYFPVRFNAHEMNPEQAKWQLEGA